jgi:CheY-like chemotaxis protein
MKDEPDHGLYQEREPHLPDCEGRGLKILIGDDDGVAAHAMAVLLKCDGHDVEIASDGPTTFQAALGNPPDVVLMDIAMPGMDGWEVARRLRDSTYGKKPFLIALTGYASEADHRRSLETGINLHLVKPVNPDFLLGLFQGLHRIVVPNGVCSIEESAGRQGPQDCEDDFPVTLSPGI